MHHLEVTLLTSLLLWVALTSPLTETDRPIPPRKRVASTGAAPTADVRELVQRVQRFYERTSDFGAGFEQVYTYASLGRKQRSRGEVIFKKPGMMRWDYATPSTKTFVLSGDRVLALDPEALTLTKGQIDSNQLSAAVTFLFGRGRLLDEFFIQKTNCADCKGQQLELTPKRQERFQRLLLDVDNASGQVLVSTVVDPDGSTNRVTFLDFKSNVGIDDTRFKLKPPPGTQTVDLTATKSGAERERAQ
ncbi:MAG: LolA family protein [Myxococcaceae bacterium]